MRRTKKSEAGERLGKVGAAARAKALSPQRRQEIARQAARKRWGRTGFWE